MVSEQEIDWMRKKQQERDEAREAEREQELRRAAEREQAELQKNYDKLSQP